MGVPAPRDPVLGVVAADRDAEEARVAEEAGDAEAAGERFEVAVGQGAEGVFLLPVLLLSVFVAFDGGEARDVVVVGLPRHGVQVPAPALGAAGEVDHPGALAVDRAAAELDEATEGEVGAHVGDAAVDDVDHAADREAS